MGFEHIIAQYGYIGMFIMLGLEYLILVVPGETLLTTVGVLSRAGTYHFNIPLLITATALGTFTGSMVTYAIGRFFGRPLLLRYGKYVFLTPKRIEQSERMFKRNTSLMILVTKYIAVVRDIVPYLAGINRMSLKRYIPLQLVASFLWTATFIGAGGVVGKLWVNVRAHWKTELIPAILILVALVYGYRMLHKRLHHALDANEESVSHDS